MHDFETMLNQLSLEQLRRGFLGWYEEMPDEAYWHVYHCLYGYKLSKKEHCKAMLLIQKEYAVMPYWTIEQARDIVKSMGVTVDEKLDIQGKKYSVYDIDFLAQRFKARFKHENLEPKHYLQMAIDDLEHCSEKAYDEYQDLKYKYEKHL